MNQIIKIKNNEGKEIELELVDEKEEIKKDEQGRLIFHRYSDGTTVKWNYDKKERTFFHKRRDGLTEIWALDANGDELWYKDTANIYWVNGKPYKRIK